MPNFPAGSFIGEILTDAPSGAAWVWLGAKWDQVAPNEVGQWDINATYAPGDLVIYPVANIAGPARMYRNSSGAFIPAGTVWDYTSWMPVFGPFHRGWFNPTIIGGSGNIGRDVPEAIRDGQDGYHENDYIVSVQTGNYNFTTGQPDATGAPVVPGMRIRYLAGVWTPELPPSESFRGYFDPNFDDGGAGVAFPVANGSTDYVSGNYLITVATGAYDFDLGETDPLGTQVTAADFIIYDGTVWQVLGTPGSLNKGWFDPTNLLGQPPAPAPVVDGTLDYNQDEYLIAVASETFDFALGEPDPMAAGTRPVAVSAGDRIIRGPGIIGTPGDTGVWEWVLLPAVTDVIKGLFDPTVAGGGPLLPATVVNGSTDYVTPDTIIAVASGFYDFGLGTPVAGVWVEAGTHWTYDAATWMPVAHVGINNKGWFDATLAGGDVVPTVVNASTNYVDGDYLICLVGSTYNFNLGIPDINGQQVDTGDRVRYNGAIWEVLSGGGGGTLEIWQSNTTYEADAIVYVDAPTKAIYKALSDHVSGVTFSADWAKNLWQSTDGYIQSLRAQDGGVGIQSIREITLYTEDYTAAVFPPIVPSIPTGAPALKIDGMNSTSNSVRGTVPAPVTCFDPTGVITNGSMETRGASFAASGVSDGDWLILREDVAGDPFIARFQVFNVGFVLPTELDYAADFFTDEFGAPICISMRPGDIPGFVALWTDATNQFATLNSAVRISNDIVQCAMSVAVDGTDPSVATAWVVGDAIINDNDLSGNSYYLLTSVTGNIVEFDISLSSPQYRMPPTGLKYSTSQVAPAAPTVSASTRRVPVLDDELVPKWYADESGGGSSILPVEQLAHGFTLGQQVYVDGTGFWALALADAKETVKVGQVIEITDVDSFIIQTSGVLELPAHGLPIGTSYFLSETTPGAVTTTPPVTGFVQLCYDVVSDNEILVQDMAITSIAALTGGADVVITQELAFPPHDPAVVYDQYWAATIAGNIYRARADGTTGAFALPDWERLGGVAPNQEPIVPDYDPIAGVYAVDQLTIESDQVYRCLIAILAPEAWNAAKWEPLGAKLLVPDYDPLSGLYAVDELTMQDGVLYRCITDILVPETFDTAKWETISGTSSGTGLPLYLYQPANGLASVVDDGEIPLAGPLDYEHPGDGVFDPGQFNTWSFGVNPLPENVGTWIAIATATGVVDLSDGTEFGFIEHRIDGSKVKVRNVSPLELGPFTSREVFTMETDGVASSRYTFTSALGSTGVSTQIRNLMISVFYRKVI